MGQQLYERPREKLMNQGVQYLTSRELLQIIIGSGSAAVSAARLAKFVEKILHSQEPDLTSLTSIKGLGVAKACQLLSAIELGRRMGEPINADTTRGVVDSDIELIRSKLPAILCIWFDGSTKEIGRKLYTSSLYSSAVIRNLFIDGIAVSARSMKIYIGKKADKVEPQSPDISLLGNIRETSKLLQIHINDVIVVTKTEEKSWRHEI